MPATVVVVGCSGGGLDAISTLSSRHHTVLHVHCVSLSLCNRLSLSFLIYLSFTDSGCVYRSFFFGSIFFSLSLPVSLPLSQRLSFSATLSVSPSPTFMFIYFQISPACTRVSGTCRRICVVHLVSTQKFQDAPCDQCTCHHHGCGAGVCHSAQHYR